MASASNFRTMSIKELTPGLAAVLGGVAGGLVFGALMQMMGMMRMVAMLVGSESPAVGWGVHLVISAFIGLTYAALFRRPTKALGAALLGLGYGVVWWVIGALLIMPARLGMEIFVLNTMAWQSLLGHMMFGVVLGLVTFFVAPRLQTS